MRRIKHRCYATGEVWKLMKDVFKALRKRGFIARMNFEDCAICANYTLDQMFDKYKDKEYAVYWHRQATNRYKKTGSLDLRYITEHRWTKVTAATIIIEELQKKGVVFSWNGNVHRTIEVFDDEFAFKRVKGIDAIPGLILEGE